ncbi:MAG TPA: hypothetical protein DDW52_05220 [Planctomycetaceae bacterium]|nr:hypothetical protein [Planctomycetaceae bacterium]
MTAARPSPKRLERREIPQLPSLGLGLRSIPAWMISLVFHVALVVILGLLWTAQPSGTGGEADRPAGIAVVYESQGEESYALVDSSDNVEGATETAAVADAIADSLSESDALIDAANEAIASMLPGSVEAGGESEAASGGIGLSGGGEGLTGSADVPKVKTSVFGIEGEGSSFVYVFDRSASMNGYSGAPLAKAKRELSTSLKSLGPAHQFQVIFYNDYVRIFGVDSAGVAQIHRGEERTKEEALRFVRETIADGGTAHIPALRRGLGLSPDVLFFLTDADRPVPNQRELDLLLDAASRAGTTLHCIQFGSGVIQGEGGWIAHLARSTGGNFRYINVAEF